jgi:hypothetical protein
MLTLEAVDIDKIILPAAAMFTERYGRPIDAKAIWPMFGVTPDYLNASLDVMLDETGRIETYLSERLNIGSEELNLLRDRYLA